MGSSQDPKDLGYLCNEVMFYKYCSLYKTHKPIQSVEFYYCYISITILKYLKILKLYYIFLGLRRSYLTWDVLNHLLMYSKY